MNKNRIGAIFLVSVLALAGIGMSYAGFTDYVQVYGKVETATVDLDIEDYSCTVIYKIYNPEDGYEWPYFPGLVLDWDNEIAQFHGFYDYETYGAWGAWPEDIVDALDAYFDDHCDFEKISYAKGYPCTVGNYNEIDMDFYNVFPCKDFIADFVIHYNGSIPAVIDYIDLYHLSGYDFVAGGWVWYEFYECELVNDEWEIGNRIPDFSLVQLHYCDYIYVKVIVHIPQNNDLQGLIGYFRGEIGVIQWYDCE